MHRIIPQLIIDNHLAGRKAGSLRAAGMFLDVTGFSVMVDALMGQGRDGAEALAGMMRAVFDPLVEAIFGQGGMIVGYAGDSISALFPVEESELDAGRRAVAASTSIQQGLNSRRAFKTPYGTFHITAKIGLALGSADWAILTSRTGEQAVYYFRGDALEGAIRAQQEALAGEVLLTDGIEAMLIGEIETGPLRSFHALQRVLKDPPAARPVSLPPVDAEAAVVFAPRDVVADGLPGEFRQTVHAFLRLPDLAEAQLREFMFSFFDLQSRYGGLLDRIDFGDKGCNLVVIWGAPTTHENDIERALSFVLDLRQYAEFPVTAGVTYHTSHAGYMGGELFETYTAYGWGISLAARLMMGAPEGSTWLDERVFQRARQRFEANLVGEQSFKGFSQKQRIYALQGRRPRPEAVFRGQWAGRDLEVRRLMEWVSPVWEGKRAAVIGIWGEAGIGKSRLLHEFSHAPAFGKRTCLWALCQADEILQRSFNPFRNWLFHYFDIASAMDPSARSRKVLGQLDDLTAAIGRPSLASELRRARPFLAALVEADWSDAVYEQLDAQARYDNTILAMITLFKAESLRQPLFLMIEDVQQLDEDSKMFVARLKRSLVADLVPYPIAILMTGRWHGRKVLLEDGFVDQEMVLEGLSDEAIAQAAEDLLGGPPAAALSRVVNQRAGGNPFFAEQVLRFLQEQGLLELTKRGEWNLQSGAEAEVLPTDLRAMLVARLDRLARRVKEVIQSASVLGRAFEVTVLARMFGQPGSLAQEVAAAEQAAVWSPLSEVRYLFNHALLRDVAYSMQLRATRRERHGLAFQAIRELCGSEVQRHSAELAYHAEQASLAEEARRYLIMAGDAARNDFQNERALDLYRRAMAFVPETDLEARYELQRACATIISQHGGLAERGHEIDALKKLAQALGDPGRKADALLLHARLVGSGGDYRLAAALAAQASDLALESGRQDVAIGAHRSLAEANYHMGLYEQVFISGEAGLTAARKSHARKEEALLLNLLGLAMYEKKNPSAAREYFEQSMAICRAENDVRGVASVLPNLGLVAGYQGNYEAAREHYEQSLRLAREIGSRKEECLSLANLGWVSGLLGDYRRAQDYAAQNLQIARELGDRYNETYALINLSSHAEARQDYSGAIGDAEQALTLARHSNDRSAQAWALTYLGHALAGLGMQQRSLQAYREALAMRSELNQPVLATEAAAGATRMSWVLGDAATARQSLEAVLSQLEQDGTLEGTDQPLRVYLTCHLVLSAMRDSRANALLNAAHDMLRTRANGIADSERRKVFLENVPWNREILALWRELHGTQPA